MVFIRVLKTPAYFSRFQVKYRRRREGKTNYTVRRKMLTQDKYLYGAPKYRLVVRRTNTKIICQVVYATVTGDRVVCSAESSELVRYGLPCGLTNYAAAYATGLLCAARLRKQMGLESNFSADDEDSTSSSSDGIFDCILDVGLIDRTTGNRAFGAMKGFVDGGVYVNHSERRFPGYSIDKETREKNFDPQVLADRIHAKHVSAYMTLLKEENVEAYNRQFSRYIKAGITPESLSSIIDNAHAAIKADPSRASSDKKSTPATRDGHYLVFANGKRFFRPVKLTSDQRKERVLRKKQLIAEALAAQE